MRIACIGAGAWGRNWVRNLQELDVLGHVYDPDAGARDAIRAAFPHADVVDEAEGIWVDDEQVGVVVATPAATHAAIVREALERGKDVMVEKPLCLSPAEGEELVALARSHGRILMVGHLLWYHPAVLKLRELVRSGELGRIRYIYSNRLNFGKMRSEENILWSFAPHDVSVMLGLLQEEPERVDSRGGNYLNDSIADITVSQLSFPSGVKGHVFVSWLHPFKEQKLVVVGERAMAVFDDLSAEAKLMLYPHRIEWRNHVPVASKAKGELIAVEATEPLRAEAEHFIERISDRQSPRTDGAEGLRVLRVLEACQRSVDTGQTVDTGARRRAAAAPAPDRGYSVHPSSCVDEGVEIGEGTRIWHFSHVLKNSRIGEGCSVGQNVVIGPDVRIGNGVKIQNNVSVYKGVELEDDVFCGPSMVFTNVYNPRSEIRRMDEIRPTLVRKGASLGANCTIVCGLTIGRYAFIGAGAVVLKDVPDYALVVGNPGRVRGWMCVCGNRIDFKGAEGMCVKCRRRYREAGGRVTLEAGVPEPA